MKHTSIIVCTGGCGEWCELVQAGGTKYCWGCGKSWGRASDGAYRQVTKEAIKDLQRRRGTAKGGQGVLL